MFNVHQMFRNEVGRASKDKMHRENGRVQQIIRMARVSWQQSHLKREALKGFLQFNQTDVHQQEVQTLHDLTIVEQINQVVIKEEGNSLPLLLCTDLNMDALNLIHP